MKDEKEELDFRSESDEVREFISSSTNGLIYNTVGNQPSCVFNFTVSYTKKYSAPASDTSTSG